MDDFEVEFRDAERFDVSGFTSGGVFRTKSDAAISAGSGTNDYEKLKNKPSIESVELTGNRELSEFGMTKAQNTDILSLFR